MIKKFNKTGLFHFGTSIFELFLDFFLEIFVLRLFLLDDLTNDHFIIIGTSPCYIISS